MSKYKHKTTKQDSLPHGNHSVQFYLNQLQRHLDPQLRAKNVSKKLLRGLLSIDVLLPSLEGDLKNNPNPTWLRDFIDDPNCGHVMLLRLLKLLQDQSHRMMVATEKPAKQQKLDVILAKEPNEEHICLLCLKAIVRSRYGFIKVLSAPRSLQTMSRCLRLSNIATKIAVLKILSLACDYHGGFEKTLKAFEDFKHFKQEKFRFESLVHSIIFPGKLNTPVYQEVVLHFFNALVGNAPTLNQRVFHQQELEQAGLSVEKVEQTLDNCHTATVYDELITWRNNYINVSLTLDEFVLLKGRSNMLRNEVNVLQTKVEATTREKNQIKVERDEFERKVVEIKLRTSELQSHIENIKSQSLKSESIQLRQELSTVVEILSPIETSVVPEPPLLVAETRAPPPPPITEYQGSHPPFRASSKRMPMLNWQPIAKPKHNTVFAQLSPNDVANDIDFNEFEEMFQLQNTAQVSTAKREAALKRLSSKVTVLNTTKARNLLIARRKISLSMEELRAAIDSCDVAMLSSEGSDLLLQFLPTVDERAALLKCSSRSEQLAEAEQFMVDLSRIERLESKLQTMSFIGSFDELFRTVSPQIEAIITASVSIMTNDKFKQLLEIVLAFGNFINGSRRGFTYAFKLESLIKIDELKSNDKKYSFLQYLVEVIRKNFAHVHSFHETIEVQPALSVSMLTLSTDVQQLRKGLDVTKSEKEKQPDNYALHNFCSRAMFKVQQITERFRKMLEKYADVCILFCEDPKLIEPSEFFDMFHVFIERYLRSAKELDAKRSEEDTLKKAELLKRQNEQLKERSIANARLAADVGKKRTSEYFDQNKNIMNQSESFSTEHAQSMPPLRSFLSAEDVRPTDYYGHARIINVYK